MIELHNCCFSELMPKLADESIDIILTDPPYLYLKNQKLDRPFDEALFFSEVKRVLKKDGFIVLFGRGTSFYRWNTILADLGFNFKEEIVWDKSHSSSPLMNVSRVHETIAIWTKNGGIINKVKVPYLEMKGHDIGSIITDIKRLKVTFNNTKSLDAVLQFFENNKINFNANRSDNHYITNGVGLKDNDRCVRVASQITNGMNEKSIMRTDRHDCETFTRHGVNTDNRKTGDRCVNAMQSIAFGLNEKSIIKQVRDHYNTIHPTQKPVRLLERLLNLVIPKDKELNEITVLDPFGGSFSTMEAANNLGLNGISCEIDKEYFESGKKRFENKQAKLAI